MRPPPIVTAALLALGTLALYGAGVTEHPPRSAEEAVLRTAANLATDGRDGQGWDWPFFPQAPDGRFLQPLPAYAGALGALATGVPEGARWVSVIAGAADVALLYLVLQGSVPAVTAVGAALLLAASPAHYAYSRLAQEGVLLVPFVLGWVAALTRYRSTPRPGRLIVAGALIGLGGFASETAPGVVALLAACGVGLAAADGRWTRRGALGALAAACGPALALAGWYAFNPAMYADTMGRWAIFAAHLRNPWEAVLALVNTNTLSTRLSTFWGLWNPAFLFFGGPDHPAGLTGFTGPLLLATGAWLGPALRRLVEAPVALQSVALVAAIAVTWTASTFGEPHPLGRALALVPLLIIISAAGWNARPSKAWHVVNALLVVAALAQSAWFLAGYSPD